MTYGVLQDFALAVGHLGDGEYFVAVGMASFGAVAVAVLRALFAAQSYGAETDHVERDEAA